MAVTDIVGLNIFLEDTQMRKAQIFILVVVVLVAGAFFVPALAAEAIGMSNCQRGFGRSI